ncbi:MAG: hypothetical protein KDI19_09390 [Pseudomonadales bacterium]|nr:hypothetical protein [Pseudomonadales bacterium]
MPEPGSPSGFEPLHVFSFVRQTEVWLVWLIFGALTTILVYGSARLPSAPILMVWWIIFGIPFAQFCLGIVLGTSQGRQQVPAMTIDGFRDTRILKLLVLVSMAVSAVFFTSPSIRPLILAVVLLVAPASFAYVAIEDSLSRALNPLRIATFIVNMGATYVALRVVVTVVLLYLLLLVDYRMQLLSSFSGTAFFSFVTVYLLLAMARCTGVLLHARRTELGLSTSFSPEQAEAAREAHEQEERNQFLGEVFDLSRVHEYAAAWKKLEARLKRDRYETEALYFSALRRWDDPTMAHKLAQGYLKRLLERSVGEAWQLLEDILETENGNYRLDSGETVLKFAEVAETDAHKSLMLGVLQHFDEDFPAHPRSREAWLTTAKFACDLGRMEEAQAAFANVTSRRGLLHKPTYDECLSRLAAYRRSR